MAKKKRPEKPQMSATAEPRAELKTKPVRLDLPPNVHRLLRLVAADDEMSMASYARRSAGAAPQGRGTAQGDQGVIYFLQPIDGGPVKIGHTADVAARLHQLELHYGRPMALLATMEGGRNEEQALHERFAHLRLGRTEQFRPDRELMEFIGRPLLVGANPDAVEALVGRLDPADFLRLRVLRRDKAWVMRFAEAERSDMSDLIDDALGGYAKARGFEAPPKR